MLRFVATFLALGLGLFALYQTSEVTGGFRHVNVLNARFCSALLGGLGIDNTCRGTSIRMPSGGMEIVSECSAVYVVILFTAGVLAFPTTWRARGLGLALGIPCILVANALRLVTLGAVIRFRASLLPLFHEYLWQVLFVFLVAALYLLWIERFVPRDRGVRAA
jgi:exosortase H (IPTLxxWG-CTERM-specific)